MSASRARQPGRPGHGLGHDGGELRRVGRQRAWRAGDADQPRTDAQRRDGREPCGAGGGDGAAHDHRMAEMVFVALRGARWEELAPQCRAVDAQPRVVGRHHRIGDADVREPGRAAMQPPGQQEVPGLQAAEGDGEPGAGRGTEDRAGGAVDAGRHVDGHHGPIGRGQRLDHAQGDALQRPRQAGAEQRVDDQLGAVQARRRQALDRARPSRGGPGGVARRAPLWRTRVATRTGQPARCRWRATTQPSPPLLPGPHSTSVGRGANRAVIARVTARPAFSISQGPGRPPAIAARSTAAMAAGGSSMPSARMRRAPA